MWNTILTVLRQSWQQFEVQILSAAPNILASVLILLAGALLGWLVARAVKYTLAGAGLDRYMVQFGIAPWLESRRVSSAASLIARGAKWLIVFVACVLALYSLMPLVISELTLRFLGYAPDIVSAVLILIVGVVASRFLARSVLIAAVNDEMRSPHLLSRLTRLAILSITVAAALEQLGIARMTVLTAFAILLGGATLTAALAVGLGSQDLVRRWLAQKSTSQPQNDDYRIRHW